MRGGSAQGSSPRRLCSHRSPMTTIATARCCRTKHPNCAGHVSLIRAASVLSRVVQQIYDGHGCRLAPVAKSQAMRPWPLSKLARATPVRDGANGAISTDCSSTQERSDKEPLLPLWPGVTDRVKTGYSGGQPASAAAAAAGGFPPERAWEVEERYMDIGAPANAPRHCRHNDSISSDLIRRSAVDSPTTDMPRPSCLAPESVST